MAAAEAEFGAQGFSRGSLNVIAREAGVSKGSLFQYFADKSDLCAYLADIVSLRIRADLEAHDPDVPLGDRLLRGSPPPRSRLGAVLRHPPPGPGSHRRRQPRAGSRLPFRGAHGREPPLRRIAPPPGRAGPPAGQLDPGADVDAFVALLMLVLPHLVIAARNPDLDALLGLGGGTVTDGERAVDRLVEAFRTGFAPRPAVPAAG